jgi:transposase
MAETTRNESFYDKEREKKVLELYHIQGKRYSYITKQLKISPNTINAILKRDREEKEEREGKGKAKAREEGFSSL